MARRAAWVGPGAEEAEEGEGLTSLPRSPLLLPPGPGKDGWEEEEGAGPPFLEAEFWGGGMRPACKRASRGMKR